MKTSRFTVVLALAAAAAAAFAAVSTAAAEVCIAVQRCWRIVRDWCVDLGLRVLRAMPKPLNTWVGAWRRMLAGTDVDPVSLREKRRPEISPRWRMCPSV